MFSAYNVCLLIFTCALLIGFYYFTTYILANKIFLNSRGIHCRYFGYRYRLKDYILTPTIEHKVDWNDVFLVLNGTLSNLPKSFVSMTKSEFRDRVFFSKGPSLLTPPVGGVIPSFLLILKNGKSRIIYTEPFSRRSLNVLFSSMKTKGILVLGGPSS
jgi:hypothetical protein